MTRYIGVAHRVKVIVHKDKPPVLRPTKLAVREDGTVTEYTLATETDELDWLRGQFPVKYRSVKPEDDIGAFPARQVVWRKAKKDENLKTVPQSHLRQVEGRTEVASKVPSKFDGIKSGDKVALVLSGSGNRLAYAASRNAEIKGAEAFHLPGFKLHGLRSNADDSDSDHLILAEELEKNKPGMFYAIEPRDRDLVFVRELLKVWKDAMKSRMAAAQRVRAHLMGQIFCNSTGGLSRGRHRARLQGGRGERRHLQGAGQGGR